MDSTAHNVVGRMTRNDGFKPVAVSEPCGDATGFNPDRIKAKDKTPLINSNVSDGIVFLELVYR